jgi:hypothetical protein
VTEDHDARVQATSDAHAAIIAEQAVSNLLTPAWHVGLSDRMEEYEPWGSDYYVRHCCEYKCVGSKDSCHALPGGKVESSAGGHAYEDSDGALGRKALASAAAVLAGLAF